MSRLRVRCKMAHTALYPGKNEVRVSWIEKTPKYKDIITISHGALDMINSQRHKGRILICDIDPDVILRSYYIRIGDPYHGKPSEYPRLKFLPEKNGDIRLAVRQYLKEHGERGLGAIDLDLTGTVKSDNVYPIVLGVVKALSQYRRSRGIKVYVTYRNGRDDFSGGGLESSPSASNDRAKWLARKISKYASIDLDTFDGRGHLDYRSDSFDKHAQRQIGSCMSIAAFVMK